MNKKVLGIGNALVDILAEEEESFLQQHNLPKGSMTLVNREQSSKLLKELNVKEKSSGGSAANTINALSRLGVNTSFIGKVGKDEYGKFFEQNLVDNGVVPQLMKGELPTGVAATIITSDSERTFATYLGIAGDLVPDELIYDHFNDFDYFHIEGYLIQNRNLIETAVKFAKEKNIKVSMDMSSYNVVEENRDFMLYLINNYVDIVFANEEETKALTETGPDEGIDKISEMCDIAVVKLDEKGSVVKKGKDKVCIKRIPPEKLVDTTAAGDFYAAGFIYGMIKKDDIQFAGDCGSLLASKVIQVLGTKLPQQVWDEVLNKIG